MQFSFIKDVYPTFGMNEKEIKMYMNNHRTKCGKGIKMNCEDKDENEIDNQNIACSSNDIPPSYNESEEINIVHNIKINIPNEETPLIKETKPNRRCGCGLWQYIKSFFKKSR